MKPVRSLLCAATFASAVISNGAAQTLSPFGGAVVSQPEHAERGFCAYARTGSSHE